MKILVIGGSGVIGSKIVKFLIKKNVNVEYTYLKNKPSFGKSNILDITNKEDTEKLITKIKPEIVIHTSALANVDLCEKNKKLADQLNVFGTENIINACKKIKCRIVYVSTSFVFDGTKSQYFEEDIPSPSTYYGITKHKSEELVKDSKLPYLILRTDQPYCWSENYQHTNSILRVLESLRTKKNLREIVDWWNVPTYVPDFVDAVWKLLEQNSEGIFHVVGSNFVNRYDWSITVANIFGLKKELIIPIFSEEMNLPVKRSNVNLSNKKLYEKTGIKMSGIKEGAIKMRDELKV